MQGLEPWLEREQRIAASAMLGSFSRTDLLKTRPGFNQSVCPARGSIVASPVFAAYDPDPDYAFHWFRDSAVVIDALRLLCENGLIGTDEASTRLGDFVRFERSLLTLDGRMLAANAGRRHGVAPDFLQFLREDADLLGIHGDAVLGESRVNPDGTLDISRWARPQHDGPPLTALALLRWAPLLPTDAAFAGELDALIDAHLGFTCRHWRTPSFDIWEEERGHHYYTLRVSAAALAAGADWQARRGQAATAAEYRAAAGEILRGLDGFWLADRGYYRSRRLPDGAVSGKALDIAVILAAIHVDDQSGAHSVADPRQQATLQQLEALFDRLYAINRDRPATRGPAMGRYEGDVYYSGGAYYFSTLGAAEFCFRAARVAAMTVADAGRWIARGDAYLQTVRRYTPDSGELSEQFDQHSGAQTSARHLAWSYAALLSCLDARRRAHRR